MTLSLISDSTKHIIVQINDYNPEYSVAIHKLAAQLKRPLKGVILLDKAVHKAGRNKPDVSGQMETIICDFSNIRSLSDAINPIADNVLAIVSSSERNQPYLKKALPHLPYVHGPSESSLDWATHKAMMRELLHSYDSNLVPKSLTVYASNEHAIESILDTISFPMVLKPTGLASSILVNRVNNEHELRSTLENSFTVIDEIYTRDKGRGKPSILAEEFIEGDMYSVDSYVDDKGHVWSLPLVKVTTAHSIGLEGFYSYRIDSALDLSAADVQGAHEVARHAILALGLRSSVAHIEFFKTKTGWKIIELGPRAGGYRQDMYALSYGIDHALNELLIKIGAEPKLTDRQQAYSAAINIYADNEGTITAIDGFDSASRNPSVYRLSLWSKPGNIALNCGNGGKFIVDGILYNKDRKQLDRDMEAVRKTIRIRTAPIKARNMVLA